MWKLETSERIARWRDFRRSLDDLPLADAVQAVAEFWHTCPFQPYYLDPADPDSWPTAWELISENYYCDLAKALGIVYTIGLTLHGEWLDAEIHVYNDPTTGYTYNLAAFDHGKYMLNYRDGTVVNKESLDKKLQLVTVYGNEQLKLKEY
jgi:hypothetical protein